MPLETQMEPFLAPELLFLMKAKCPGLLPIESFLCLSQCFLVPKKSSRSQEIKIRPCRDALLKRSQTPNHKFWVALLHCIQNL